MKLFSVKYDEEARDELNDAILWYREISNDLAKDFKTEFHKALKIIKSNPALYRLRKNKVRFSILNRFPYSIQYLVKEDCVYIMAVFHHKRNQKTAIKRLKK
jgi:plasmid stabilization system protein ParE